MILALMSFLCSQVSLGQLLLWRVPPTTLGPHLSIGSSGFMGQHLRPPPRVGKGRPSRRCILRASLPLSFGIPRSEIVGPLDLKTTKVKEIRYGKVCRARTAVAMAKGRMKKNHSPPLCTKNPEGDDVVQQYFSGKLTCAVTMHSCALSDMVHASGRVKTK